ncbi:MAG: glycosyltransferase family 2 protein [Nanoarchaeota archaeon]|nr:glycosyltransferase family 2 protein [DPANN group archaeon]MBL7116266.1 glycosyltransferase family 2 protein [Nanoarchaeota archaeon]
MTKLSVIIPVYNEKRTLLKLLEKVKKVDLGDIKKEILIVDDFSTDGTRDILKKINDPKIKIFFHKKNYGKGIAIRTALKNITGDIVIIQDADMEYDPNDYSNLIKPIIDGRAEVVYGNRFHKGHNPKYIVYYLGNILLSVITGLLYRNKVSDIETCYKVIKREVYNNINLRAKRFDFEPEITAKILKKGYKIYEVPIWYRCRDFKEGKKINWRDGIEAIWTLVRYRFSN